jgi:tetratricopeptide (TPR) repeat protein
LQAQRYLEEAQQAFKATNDRMGEIRCLSMAGHLTYARGDYANSLSLYKHCLSLTKGIGWRYANSHNLSAIGNCYFELGNYLQAKNFHQQALIICKEVGNLERESMSLDTLGLIFHFSGEFTKAKSFYEKALEIDRKINNPRSKSYVLTHLGNTLIQLKQVAEAEDYLNQALKIRLELEDQAAAIDTRTGLARLAQAKGEQEKALGMVIEILTWINDKGTDGIELPAFVYLACYQILKEAADSDIDQHLDPNTVLKAGYDYLQIRTTYIQDDDLRRQFLENVPYNRDLLAAWQAMQS